MGSFASLLLAAHVITGTLAVLAGPFALLSRKGGRRHRQAGRFFARMMAVVIASAALLLVLEFRPYLAALTALSGFIAFSGVRVLGRKQRTDRAAVIDWAAALSTLAFGSFLLVLTVTGRIADNAPVLFATGGGAVGHAIYDLVRFSVPGRLWTPRLWLYEHVLRLIGAYFGAVAAFSGSVLLFLPPPWRQLWAPLLGQTLAVGWVSVLVISSATRRRRSGAPS